MSQAGRGGGKWEGEATRQLQLLAVGALPLTRRLWWVQIGGAHLRGGSSHAQKETWGQPQDCSLIEGDKQENT